MIRPILIFTLWRVPSARPSPAVPRHLVRHLRRRFVGLVQQHVRQGQSVLQARDDAASFVASDGRIRGAQLEAALRHLRERMRAHSARATCSWRRPSWRCDPEASAANSVAGAVPAGLHRIRRRPHCNWSRFDRSLTPAQAAATQQLLADAVQRLPAAWVDALDQRIEVEWRDDLPAQVHGRAQGRQLLLDRALLDGWMARPSDAGIEDPATRAALAAVIHELAHFYDRTPQGRLSRDPRLLDLAGWQVSPMRLGLRTSTTHSAIAARIATSWTARPSSSQ